jgi:hypothetical protein
MLVTSIECLPFTKLSCYVTSSLIIILSVNVKFPSLSLGAFEVLLSGIFLQEVDIKKKCNALWEQVVNYKSLTG